MVDTYTIMFVIGLLLIVGFIFFLGSYFISRVDPNDNIPDRFDAYIKSRNRPDSFNKKSGYILFSFSVICFASGLLMLNHGSPVDIGYSIIYITCGFTTLVLAILNFHPQKKSKR